MKKSKLSPTQLGVKKCIIMLNANGKFIIKCQDDDDLKTVKSHAHAKDSHAIKKMASKDSAYSYNVERIYSRDIYESAAAVSTTKPDKKKLEKMYSQFV